VLILDIRLAVKTPVTETCECRFLLFALDQGLSVREDEKYVGRNSSFRYCFRTVSARARVTVGLIVIVFV
jgi:hypothetical protein